MDRYAIIKDGLVENVCLWDGDESNWRPPKDTTVVQLQGDDPVSPGYLFDGKQFSYGDPPSSPSTGSDPQMTNLLEVLKAKGTISDVDVAAILQETKLDSPEK